MEALERTSSRRNGLLRAVGTQRSKNENNNIPLNGMLVDATAGSGADAALLSWHGWNVIMLEREVATHASLSLALSASDIPGRIADRLRLHQDPCDAREVLRSGIYRPEVVYLSPMFPASKSSKNARNEPGGAGYTVYTKLRGASAPPPDLIEQRQMLDAALLALSPATGRVVVKRPIRAPPLGNVKPCRIVPSSVKRSRRRVRFDVYFAGGHPRNCGPS